MDEFESDHCPVCHRQVEVHTDIQLTPEQEQLFGDEIYRPGDKVEPAVYTSEQEAQRRELEEFLNQNRRKTVEIE